MKKRTDTKVNTESRLALIKTISAKIQMQGAFYRVAAIAVLVILLCFLLLFFTINRTVTEQCIEADTYQFLQIERKLENISNTVNMTATQVLLDNVCSEWLFASANQHFDSTTITSIKKQLKLYQYTNSLIDSICMYNGERDEVISTKDSTVQNLSQLNDAWLKDTLTNFSTANSRRLLNHDDVYSYVVNYYADNVVIKAIVINLNKEELIEELNNVQNVSNSQIIIQNLDGEIWASFGDEDYYAGGDLLQNFESNISETSSYCKNKNNGIAYYISRLQPTANNYVYFKITRWNDTFQIPIKLLKLSVIVLLVVVFVVGIITVVGHIALKILDSKFVKGEAEQEGFGSQNLKALGLLNRYISVENAYQDETILAELNQNGLITDDKRRISLFIISFESQQRDIVETCKSIENHLNSLSNVHGIIKSEDTIIFLSSPLDFSVLVERMQPQLSKYNCNLIIANRETEYNMIYGAVNDALQLRKEEFFYPTQSVLLCEEIKKDHSELLDLTRYDYARIANDICAAENGYSIYTEYVKQFDHVSAEDYYKAVLILTISVIHRINALFTITTEIQAEIDELFSQLTQSNRKIKVDNVFKQLCDLICEIRSALGTNATAINKVALIQDYIEQNYSDQMMSVETLGAKFGLSSNYLGRIFKGVMRTSVSEYINDVRFRKILIDLRTTNKPVKDIVESAGFGSITNFYSYFKKKTGMSPSMYRQLEKEKEKGNQEYV